MWFAKDKGFHSKASIITVAQFSYFRVGSFSVSPMTETEPIFAFENASSTFQAPKFCRFWTPISSIFFLLNVILFRSSENADW